MLIAHAADWITFVPVVIFLVWLLLKAWRDRRDERRKGRSEADEGGGDGERP